MNMVRIRQIMEVRKALKAPPLLPPKVRGKHKSSEADKKNSIKEIIHLDLRAHLLNNPTTSAEKLIEASISDNDYDGPWKTVSTPRLRVLDDLLEVYDLCSIDYTFQKRQCIKFELYNLVKPNNILLGYTIFPISEIICENGFLSKDIISEDNEEPLLRISISYWLETSEPPVLLQFVGRNLSKKAISDNLRFQFKIYRIEINDERYLIYQSEFLPFISKVIWKQFFLRKSLLADEINRKLEVVCYQRDNAGKDEIVGRFQTSFSEMQRYLETQDVYFLNKSLKAIKKEKATATFDIIKCSETIMCSFLDYISAGSRIQTAIAIDFSTSASPTGNEIPAAILVDDIELVLFTLLETLKDYNLIGFARILPIIILYYN